MLGLNKAEFRSFHFLSLSQPFVVDLDGHAHSVSSQSNQSPRPTPGEPYLFLLLARRGVAFRVGRLVHGNTLTAAVVVENIKAAVRASVAVNPHSGSSALVDDRNSYGAPCGVFLTGATSKVQNVGGNFDFRTVRR